MSPSFDFPDPPLFTTGTVGPPGERVFYLQVGDADAPVALKMEKQQVAALAEHLAGLLADLPPLDDVVAAPALVEPVAAAWAVGGIGIAVDDDDGRITIVVQELVPDDVPEEDAATARMRVDRDQIAGFVARALELVAAGRPTCRFCGFPMDPAGHLCPRAN